MRPVILVVEDTPDVIRAYERALPGCDRIMARSIREAWASFKEHRWALDIVIMDGEVPGAETTEDLVRDMRTEGYTGPIIAASGQPTLNVRLMKAGCTHTVPAEAKDRKSVEAIRIVTDILLAHGSMPPQPSKRKRGT